METKEDNLLMWILLWLLKEVDTTVYPLFSLELQKLEMKYKKKNPLMHVNSIDTLLSFMPADIPKNKRKKALKRLCSDLLLWKHGEEWRIIEGITAAIEEEYLMTRLPDLLNDFFHHRFPLLASWILCKEINLDIVFYIGGVDWPDALSGEPMEVKETDAVKVGYINKYMAPGTQNGMQYYPRSGINILLSNFKESDVAEVLLYPLKRTEKGVVWQRLSDDLNRGTNTHMVQKRKHYPYGVSHHHEKDDNPSKVPLNKLLVVSEPLADVEKKILRGLRITIPE